MGTDKNFADILIFVFYILKISGQWCLHLFREVSQFCQSELVLKIAMQIVLQSLF